MRVLVLGGTRFVGRLLVEEALARGHVVTTFNRGRTDTDVEGVEVVRGDRESPDDLARLVEGHDWDAVVDTSGYVPAVVGDATRALSGRAGSYLFFSTVSVYPGWPQEGVSEDSPVYDCAPDVGGTAEDEANWSAAQYGTHKAGCERAVTEGFDGRALVLRPGVILGPYENVGRLTWWLTRIAAGGTVLVPGDPGRPIQPIDIRDLIGFTLDRLEAETAGTFNVAAPIGHATFGGMLDACVEVTGSDAHLVWVDDGFLLDLGVRQWTEIPLWRTHPGTWRIATDRAQASGLACRPIGDTVHDTWAWLSAGQGPAAYGRQAHHGLAPDKERQLLALWAERTEQAERRP
ncbi:MAG: NAD-dependent epimerase/dehydratase family protein [Streptosporangiales bacterium]|nr:NAD-dependent epimerase/dehydratase family protein [Streptosporangiales bacterium]